MGAVEAAQHDYAAAARRLCALAERDPPALASLLALIPPGRREAVALVR